MPYLGVIPILIEALGAAASAAGTAYSIQHGQAMSQEAKKAAGHLTTPSPADMAASGQMRSENLGAATPQWKGGLEGSSTGPMPGAGSLTTQPITGWADFKRAIDTAQVGGGGAL